MSFTIYEYIEQINKTNAETEALFDELQMLIGKKEYDKYDTEIWSKFVALRKKEKEMTTLSEDREDNREYMALLEKWVGLSKTSKKTVKTLLEREQGRGDT